MKKRYWLTPPAVYGRLDPEKYNSLTLPWGKSNYVNPPFLKSDAPHGGPAAFVRKAIEERDRGNMSVLILPIPWSIHLLMQAGAEIRYGGQVRWLDVETGEPCKRNAPQIIAVLR